MNLLDLALKYNDYDWAKEIYNFDHADYTSALDTVEADKTELGLFNEKGIALEDILAQYAVVEKDGLRNFNINSDFDRNEADLVLVEKPPYAKGGTVKYYAPSKMELIQMRGIVNGYMMGYREAFFDINKSYLAIFDQMEAGKKDTGNKAKRERKNSGKLKNKNTAEAE